MIMFYGLTRHGPEQRATNTLSVEKTDSAAISGRLRGPGVGTFFHLAEHSQFGFLGSSCSVHGSTKDL